MINKSFQKLLQTGQLGVLNLDLSVDKVFEVLGEPDWDKTQTDIIPNSELQLVYYGDLRITILDNELILFDMECHFNRGIPEQVGYEEYEFIQKLTFHGLGKILKQNNQKYKKADYDDGSFLIWVPLESDLYFLIVFEDPDRIYKIALANTEMFIGWNIINAPYVNK